MPKRQKRDRDYFKRRLLYEFPTIHADLLAGKYRTVNEAAVAAGLIKPPSALNALKRAWTKADSAERKDFLSWARGKSPPRKSRSTRLKPMVSTEGHVEPWAKKRIAEIMAKRRMVDADVTRELKLKLKRNDTSHWAAIRGQTKRIRLDPITAAAFEEWIEANQYV